MNHLELLDKVQQSDELRRNISTAALLWAISSVVAFLAGQLGWIASYEDALPVVILVTWLGSEIASRLPTRIPVAICEKDKHVQILPNLPLRRFWPWKKCTKCGSSLKYTCPDNHLLSLFVNQELPETGKPIWCSQCGSQSPLGKLSSDEYLGYLDFLAEYNPPRGLEPHVYWEQLSLFAKNKPEQAEIVAVRLAKLFSMIMEKTELQATIVGATLQEFIEDEEKKEEAEKEARAKEEARRREATKWQV